jgi:methionine-rich copper-binding protein CopC
VRRNRLTLALAAAASVSALATATAFAHETVKSTSPAKGKTASRHITSATVTFNGQIRSGSMKVTGPGGKVVSSGQGGRDPRNVKRLRVPLKSGLKAGSYKATWKIVASDGDNQSGSFTFKLK